MQSPLHHAPFLLIVHSVAEVWFPRPTLPAFPSACQPFVPCPFDEHHGFHAAMNESCTSNSTRGLIRRADRMQPRAHSHTVRLQKPPEDKRCK